MVKPGDSPEKILTAQEVSRYLRIPLSTLYDLTKRGKIKGVKVGKHWRYLEKNIRAYLFRANPFSSKSSATEFPSERRHFPRINCEWTASVSVPLSRKQSLREEGMIHNLSAGGALFVSRDGGTLEAGDPVRLVFEMKGSPSLEIEGRIVRRPSDTAASPAFGIKFRNISCQAERRIQDYVG